MDMPMNNTCMDIAMSVEKAAVSAGYAMRTKVRHVPGADPRDGRCWTAPGCVRVNGKDAVDLPTACADLRVGSCDRGESGLFRRPRPPSQGVQRRKRDRALGTILNGAVSGRPMTYSVGGRQYLAIAAGGVTQGHGLLEGLTPELNTPRAGNTLFVFALAEQAR